MTRIKKWILMLVLTIMLVPTTNVFAKTYTSKDNIIIDAKYYEFFKSQFGEDNSYKFFSYSCRYDNYDRTCYYGIDKNFNYVDISYTSNSYSDLTIKKGIDTDFSVVGSNIIEIKPSANYQILYAFCFFFVFYLVNMMTSIIFSKNKKGRR